ncbi:MAG TPA: DNA ligase D [Polyangiaceae bacterium]
MLEAEQLDSYRQKRDPTRTNEPFSPERKRSGSETRSARFVVHLHAATRTHYDVRLQVGGVLKSFAVPRGPSLNPEDKRLAVHTEDHPLEYLDFEEVIPEGNYGAGPMIVWDAGRVRYLESAAESGLEHGKLDFELYGFKLRGRFALVHTGDRPRSSRAESNQWLLFKKGDAFANTETDLVSDQPFSVLSGLRVEELGQRREIARRLEERAAELGAPERELDARKLTPMLCATSGAGSSEPNRFYELKLDGVRILADKHPGGVALRYRNGRAATASYPEIARAVRALAAERLVLDGEIVTFDDAGRPNFQRLAPRIHAVRPLDVLRASAEVPVVYVVFDLLAVGRRELLTLPLESRKALLEELNRGPGMIRVLDHFEGDGTALFEFCKAQRLEGMVAKHKNSPYRPGPQRSEDWVKIKCDRDDEFVVIGWLRGKRARERLGALCLGSFSNGALRFRGRVGSGLTERSIDELLELLKPLQRPDSSAAGAPPDDLKEAQLVEPKLVVSVRFQGWTEEGRLRAPVFLGLRGDIEPSACTASPPEESLESAPGDRGPGAPQLEGDEAGSPTSSGGSANQVSARVILSNRDKVFWPDDGYTKGDLIDYYATVAPAMLRFLRGRPVVLVRYPDGVDGKHFYQWNAPLGTPEWMRTLELSDKDQEEPGKDPEEPTKKQVFLIDDVDGLAYIANLGCIPIHVLASREKSPHDCDFLTIDFDIGEKTFRDAVVLALSLKELLDELSLPGFAKTSGQKGLHTLIPLGPGASFETAKIMVELLGRLLVAQHPKLATMERRISKRGPRVFVDTGQTGASRTIVAPYSVRAVPGATVSTPLSWSEVHVALDPARFNLMSVPSRLSEVGDPWVDFFSAEPDIPQAIEKLAARLART